MSTVHDPEIEDRLRSMLSARAQQVDQDRVHDRLSVPILHEQAREGGRTWPGVVAVLVAAAAVATVATGSLALSNKQHHASTSPPAAAAAAAAATTASRSAAAGSVTYVHDSDGPGVDVWIPSDRSGTWELVRPDLPDASKTEKADCAAFRFFQTAANGVRQPDGSYKSLKRPHVPSCEQGSWDFYRPAFAASLPTDPAALLAAMRKASYRHSDVNTFVTGSGFIDSGWVEPNVVANIVAALKLIPGVHVTHEANSAGVTGEALSYSGRAKPTVLEHYTVIVNPDTNQVIGSKLSYPGGSDNSSLTYHQVNALGDTK